MNQRAIPALIKALGDGPTAVSDRAHEALQQLTEQKFGKDAAAWQQWWQAQKKQ
jgi:hypothetical protein